ncbi:DNA/RNA non-specific endonuclease [Eleftheria terrae]|uniref:DNA/RNA non-specific endonuclease n=1 Tax=Eleftheria terrae TaxID=1597781 RepID=UPI00263B37F9|nr:DNA/RNA non-specific endonuclease [Eleftheria terrae]WKB55853.1 DNA/RNA non-specific endonuclease [Eleftheria terrae]
MARALRLPPHPLIAGLRAAALAVLLVLGVTPRTAQAGFEQCRRFFVSGHLPSVPASAPGQRRELCFDGFAVLHSGVAKTPLYAVERLSRAQLLDARGEARTDRFYEEARLPRAERARLDDYRGTRRSGRSSAAFDRGHMAPAADMPHARAMAQSFSLANIAPQAPQNNRRAWAGIEKATRKYVLRARGDVYVFTGPVFERPARTLGRGRVWVPRYFYKLVYDPSTRRAWAHWIENRDEARASRPLSYEALVQRTGIRFLPAGAVRG